MAILRADLAFRRKCYIGLGVFVVLCFALFQWGLPGFESIFQSKRPEEALRILNTFIAVIFFAIFILAMSVLRFAKRILEVEQFPLPGSKVLKDTEIIEGVLARRKAYVLIVFSLVLAVMGLFGAVYFPYNLNKAIRQKTNEGDLWFPQELRPR
ncbi:MAG: hypothetical protein WCA04_08845 [Geobacteraceae bacterium]